jgi:hypothetical protein
MSSSPSKRNGSADVATKIVEDVNTDDAQQFQQIIRDRKGKVFFLLSFFKIISAETRIY